MENGKEKIESIKPEINSAARFVH